MTQQTPYPSLKKRLFWIFILLIVFLALSYYVAFNFIKYDIRDDVSRKNEAFAHAVAEEVSLFLSNPATNFQQLRHLVNDTHGRTELRKTLLTAYLYNPAYACIEVIDANGDVFMTIPEQNDQESAEPHRHDYFIEHALPGKIYWSGVFPSPHCGRMTVTMVGKLRVGLLVVHIKLSTINQLAQASWSNNFGFAAIVDQQGAIVGHSNPDLAQQGKPLPSDLVIKHGLAGFTGTLPGSYDDEPGLFSISPISLNGWSVVIFQTDEKAYSAVRLVQILNFTTLFCIFFFTWFAITLFNKHILAPVTRLTSQVDRVARGEYEVTPDPGFAEFENMTHSFNVMVESVKSRENALRESEAFIKTIIENGPDTLLILDSNNVILFASTQAASMFIVDNATDLFGMPFLALWPEESLDIIGQASKGALQGKRTTFLATIPGQTPADRIWLDTAMTTLPMQKKGEHRFLVSIRDVTPGKIAEQEQRNLQELLVAILDSMPSILMCIDTDYNILQWNRAAVMMSGITQNQAVGKHVDDVIPRLRNLDEFIQQVIETGELVQRSRVPMRDGEMLRFVNVLIYPLGHLTRRGVTILVEDVSQKVRMEETMIQTEKMLSVGGLAAGMAHEINNPLGAILQASQNITRRVSSDLPGNVELADKLGLDLDVMHRYMDERLIFDFLDDIMEAGSRAADIVRNMLDFSRESESKHMLCDIHQLLDTTLNMAASDYDLKKQYDFRKISVHRQYKDRLPSVYCMKTEIEQVVLNLLRNAAQAMHDAPREGTVPTITIRTEYTADTVVIIITDNGPGMTEETRKRVFEPFFTTKAPGIGTGLGLSVSYFIITRNHGGEFDVQTAEGVGTTFIITLPRTQPQKH